MNRISIEKLRTHKPIDSILEIVCYVDDYITPTGKKYSKVLCKCECGTLKEILASNYSKIKSCGCNVIEKLKRRSQKYFPVIKDLFDTYHRMMSRCYYKKHGSYTLYGGRGVVVCEEWKNDYQKFLDWALANGWKKGLHLDKDIKGNGMLYSPETCQFVTRGENNDHTKRTLWYEYKGEKRTLKQICDMENIKRRKVYSRIKYLGMNLEDALFDGNYKRGNRIKRTGVPTSV